MTEEEINELDKPNDYKVRDRSGNEFVNIIYKMLADGYDDETIFYYLVLKKGITASYSAISGYIAAIALENFPDRINYVRLRYYEKKYPDDVIRIKRLDLLKFILTSEPKKGRDEIIAENIDTIKRKFPIVAWVEAAFKEFHGILMGDDLERLDEFISEYEESRMAGFCYGLKKDIAAVKNAISLDVSSGFVEGNNNKFKLIKRILYGRAKIVNLSKKCKLAFLQKMANFNLLDLMQQLKIRLKKE